LNDVVSRAKKSAWPSLSILKGKIIVIISGDDTFSVRLRERRNYYASMNFRDRIGFVDMDHRFEDIVLAAQGK